MAPFQKILVPVDFSPYSKRALEMACELARRFESSMLLFHAYVIPTYPLPEGYVLASPATVTELLDKTQKALADVKANALQLGAPRVEVAMSEGVAFAEIVRTAREQAIDLIVMGTHGRTGLKHALMGSVAEKVVRKAPCAVLTVRDPDAKFEQP